MNSKLNIEEIKYLVPDYISGLLSGDEKTLVESALKESAEVREFYEETKLTFQFVKNVKFEEPPAQYWNSLLPRIHERIEASQSKKFSWDSISAFWKIIVPVAAVILIFVIYQLVKSPEGQLTKKEINKEQIKTDSSSKNNNSLNEKKKEAIENKEEKIANENPVEVKSPKVIKKNNVPKQENTATDLNKKDEEENKIDNTDLNEEFASIDTDDLSILASGSSADTDEETDNELSKLSGNEKDQLLQELLKSNL